MGQISGKIIKILPVVTGQGKNGEWIKQEFVIETADQYPKKICCVAWGTMASNMDSYLVGERIIVHYNIESREYNEKWFTEVRAWKVDREGVHPAAKPKQETKKEDSEFTDGNSDNLPF